MFRKIAAVYSIVIGTSVLGMWSMIILTGGISEGPVEISFHLISEFLMAILLLFGGIELLRCKSHGWKLFLISYGMLIYSVLNAAGYYGQRGDITMTIMFLAIFAVSLGFLLSGLLLKANEAIQIAAKGIRD